MNIIYAEMLRMDCEEEKKTRENGKGEGRGAE